MEEPASPAEHRPHPARHVFSKAGITVLGLFIIGAFVGSAYIAQSLIQSGQLASVVTSVLVDLTNEDRQQETLGTLTVNPVLTEAAQAKANDMAEKGYFAHTSPEGINPWYWMHQAGYTFTYAGENLAVNFSDSEDVTKAWMDSPTHRANILNGQFTEIGIATAVGEYKGHKTTFVVQMFGAPRTSTAVTPVREVTTITEPEDIAVATTQEDSEILGTGVSEDPTPVPVVSENAEPVAVAPALDSTITPAPRYASDFEVVLTSPATALRTLYILCALFILLALALATRMELRRHHTPHAVAAVCLVLLMSGLFITADWLVFTHPVVAQTLASLPQ